MSYRPEHLRINVAVRYIRWVKRQQPKSSHWGPHWHYCQTLIAIAERWVEQVRAGREHMTLKYRLEYMRGVPVTQDDLERARRLERRASKLMYRAKDAGNRDVFEVFFRIRHHAQCWLNVALASKSGRIAEPFLKAMAPEFDWGRRYMDYVHSGKRKFLINGY